MTATRSEPTAVETPTRIPLSTSIGLGTGSMLQPLNSSMIAVAVVAIAAHYGSPSAATWVISALYIATAVTGPAAGRLGELFGARRVYTTGLVLIAIGSIMGTLAPSIGWLIAARVILGIGTATQYPTAMTIVRTMAERTGARTSSAIAVLSVCAQSMVALGPTLGGLLVGLLGWQSIFWVNLPMVLLTFFWVRRVTPADTQRIGGLRPALAALDVPGLVLFLGMLTSTMFLLLSLGGRPAWWLLPVIVVLAAGFVARERRTTGPFIDVRALARNRALTLTLGRTFAVYTCFYCIFFGVPQWLMTERGFSAMTAGLLMLPVAVTGICATMLATAINTRAGARVTLAIGMVGLLIAGLALGLAETVETPLIGLVLVSFLLGMPNGFNNIGNQNVINAVSGVSEVGTAIGMYRTVQYMAANMAAVVLELTLRPGDGGLRTVGLFLVIVAALGLVGVLASRTLRSLR